MWYDELSSCLKLAISILCIVEKTFGGVLGYRLPYTVLIADSIPYDIAFDFHVWDRQVCTGKDSKWV